MMIQSVPSISSIRHEWNCTEKTLLAIAEKKIDELEGTNRAELGQVKVFLSKIKSILSAFKNEQKQQAKIQKLKLSYLRCKYRFSLIGKKEIREALKEQLTSAAIKFKQTEQNCFDKSLKDYEIQDLETLCRYDKIARFLLANPSFQKNFFKSCLRDNLGIDELCRYNLERLYRYKIHYHLGAFHEIKMIKAIDDQEDVFLGVFCEGRYINAFDLQQKITFRDGYALTWRQILKEFSKADERSIEFTFFQDGLHHWNAIMRGPEIDDPDRYIRRLRRTCLQTMIYRIKKIFKKPSRMYGTIDLSKPEFWEKLPVFKILTQEQLERRYGIKIQPSEIYFKIIEASRSNPTLDALNSHSFMTLCQRIEANRFKIYPFGIFSKSWPRNFLSKIYFLGGTYEGIVAYPDPNMFTPFRQKASHVIQDEPGSFENACSAIAKLNQEGIAFQYLWENCTALIERTTPGFSIENFTCRFYDIDLRGPIVYLQKIWKGLKGKIQKIFEECIHLLCRSKRLFLGKCVYNTPVKENFSVRVPANLHELIFSKKISGILGYGHPREKIIP